MRRLAPMIALAASLMAAWTGAGAHHILGIPHYRYGEEYPQIPYMEVIAGVGTKELVFTHFPGFPRPGERVRFKLYVRDTSSGEAFREPLQAEVFRISFLGGGERVAAPLTIVPGSGPEHNDYKFFMTFDQAEAYEVRVRFPSPGGDEIIPFPVTIGRTDDRPLVLGAACLLGLTVAAVGLARRRRRRSSRALPRRGPAAGAAPPRAGVRP